MSNASNPPAPNDDKQSSPKVKVLIPDALVEYVQKGQLFTTGIFWCFFTIFLSLATCILGIVSTKTNPTWFEFTTLGGTSLLAVVFLLLAIWYPRKIGGT